MISFVVFAVLAANWIFSPVLAAGDDETKVDPFDLYKELYKEYLQQSEEAREKVVNDEYVPAHNNLKKRRNYLCELVKDFEDELEKEFLYFNWTLDRPTKGEVIKRALLYFSHLAINYHDYAKAQYYLYRFSVKFGLEVSPEQKKNAEDFKLIAALLTLFSDNEMFNVLIYRWVSLAQFCTDPQEKGSISKVGTLEDGLKQLVNYRNKNDFANESEDVLEIQITDAAGSEQLETDISGNKKNITATQKFESFKRLIGDYFNYGGRAMTSSEHAIASFFPDAKFPSPKNPLLSDSENTKLLSKLRKSEPNLLDSKSIVGGSRIVEILKHLLLSDFEEDYRKNNPKSSPSTSDSEADVSEAAVDLLELKIGEKEEVQEASTSTSTSATEADVSRAAATLAELQLSGKEE